MGKLETELPLIDTPPRAIRDDRTPSIRRLLLLSLLTFVLLGWSFSGVVRRCCNLLSTPTKQQSGIAWSSCPDVTEFECAYLTVPLDYTNPLPNETVSLALRRLPASASVKERRGTLFVNPGGPGGSGTEMVVRSGPAISTILKGRYDILSWDPRGVNMTTPPLDCYPSDWDEYMQNRKQELLGFPSEARLSSGSSSSADAAELAYTKKMDAYFRAGKESCDKNGNGKMLSAVSTAFVARDMVSILEALGEAERGMQYWGFSYGTILGATFSAMFPELVYRVVLDGVSDSVSFTNDIYAHGQSSMTDSNKVWAGFVTACAKAGPEGCALAKPNSTSEEIKDRVDALVERLAGDPLSVPFTGLNSGIVTSSDVLAVIFRALYAPREWPKVAQALAAAESGDGSGVADLTGFPNTKVMSRRDPLDNVFGRYMTTAGGDISGTAVLCGETDPEVVEAKSDPKSFIEYSRSLEKLSITGGRWAQFIGRCRSWGTKAREAYRGPWTVEDGFKKTKFPVLFLGNTADPVTPLAAAKSMSNGFGNESATLLIQDGFGHCSLAQPSLCTAHTLQGYFFDGEVPEYGTLCKSDEGFLFPTSADVNMVDVQSAEDRKVREALEELSAQVAQWI